MNISEMLGEAPTAPEPPTSRCGVTPDGTHYTVTVVGGDACSRVAVMKVDDIMTAPPSRTVEIDHELVCGSLDPRPEPVETPPTPPTTITTVDAVERTGDTPEALRYRELKYRVWDRLHRDLHEREHTQKMLKHSLRHHSYGKFGHPLLLKACEENAYALTCLRRILAFLRSGCSDDRAPSEEVMFNWLYAAHPNFRNDFWTFWNLKHPSPTRMVVDTERENPLEQAEPSVEVRVEPNTTTAPDAGSTVDDIEYTDPDSYTSARCESCGCFISPISHCCSRCGRRY